MSTLFTLLLVSWFGNAIVKCINPPIVFLSSLVDTISITQFFFGINIPLCHSDSLAQRCFSLKRLALVFFYYFFKFYFVFFFVIWKSNRVHTAPRFNVWSYTNLIHLLSITECNKYKISKKRDPPTVFFLFILVILSQKPLILSILSELHFISMTNFVISILCVRVS